MLFDPGVGGVGEQRLQIVDVALDAVGDVAVGPVDGDVLAVALGQTIPFLVGEDVEVEGVEGGQVGRGDGLGLTVVSTPEQIYASWPE